MIVIRYGPHFIPHYLQKKKTKINNDWMKYPKKNIRNYFVVGYNEYRRATNLLKHRLKTN